MPNKLQATFEVKKDPTKVFIAGTGSGWQAMPPQTEKTVYCLNDYVYAEKYGIEPDILFIMDVLDEKPQVVSGIQNLGETIQRINALKCPLIGPFRYEEIPLSERFPLEECFKEFGMPYFSNTISYMIAYAILKGAKEIDTFGVNQASSSEYFYEKAGVEYWLGVANGRGIKITINGDKSELLTNKVRFGGNLLYGYNQTYQEILDANKKFGEPIIKKLLAPPKKVSKTIREITT